MKPDSRTRRTFLFIALGLFLAAAVWLAILESKSYTRALCTRINSFGYSVSPADLYTQAYGNEKSISEVVEEDLETVIEQSKGRGFDADVNRVGRVELMLWHMSDGRVMVIYLVDREPELVFIEDPDTGDTFPIGRE
ncbi:MAG: hypothetical protein J5586_05065 [Clostridia bacterium]|nr:hypothetical protein [Clostridia bacterium]